MACEKCDELKELIREFIEVGEEFYDMDMGPTGSELIERARKILDDDGG